MRRDLIIGVLVSLLIHFSVAYFGEMKGGPVKAKVKAASPTVELIEMPPIEPDTPEVVDEDQPPPPPADFAPPMQNDVPQIVTDTAFVQQLEPPPPQDMEVNKTAIIVPSSYMRSGMEVFNIKDLDQIPVATVKVPARYPFEMRRAGVSGQVVVDFIVDTSGTVRNAYAASSTQRDFEAAAVQAVSKWQFRPGRKGGRAVNTHMLLPMVFKLNASD